MPDLATDVAHALVRAVSRLFSTPASERRMSACATARERWHRHGTVPFMPRYAFQLRIKPDAIEEYEREHQRVWPELLAKLKQVGISDYSIFRRGQELVLSLRVDDFDKAWDELDRDPVNQRWQQFMSRLFEPVPDLQPGERFAMMKEVFRLE
jgi:L-rhamnose mutarotase